MKRTALVLGGASLLLTVTLSASAGTREANTNPELQKAETCIRAALRKEDLAIKYIREGKLSDVTISDTVIEPAITDILVCAAHALSAAVAADEISSADAKDVDSDMTDAAVADVAARHSVSGHKIGQAISSLQEANRLKEKALTALETAAARPPKPPLSPVFAVFVPRELATRYSVNATPARGAKLPAIRWILTLEQIDPNGSSPAGYQSVNPQVPSYSSAALDPSCNNSRLPNGQQISTTGRKIVYSWSGLGNEFTWYHGDKGSYPGSSYGCDHTRMGARGHQGIVTVEIAESGWTCTASISGTNLSLVPIHGAGPVCTYNP